MLTESDLRRRLGRGLVRYRRHTQMTQRELADRLGVHHSEVSRWERGERTPNTAALIRIIVECQINPRELFEPRHRRLRGEPYRGRISA